MNPTSGDFSLQASGFMIKDGKIDKPISLVTVAGNLFAIFNDILEVGSDSELQLSGFTAPSVIIKEIAVSGE
jgi:PmbA protein